jgi:hypothetical protein
MRTTLIALVVVLLASTALTADRNKLPAQFVGDWCLDNSGDDKGPSTYRLGRCLPSQDSSDSWLTVRADGFIAHDTRCSVFQAAADKNSNFLVKFQCSGEGQLGHGTIGCRCDYSCRKLSVSRDLPASRRTLLKHLSSDEGAQQEHVRNEWPFQQSAQACIPCRYFWPSAFAARLRGLG